LTEVFVKDGKVMFCENCFPDSVHIVLDWPGLNGKVEAETLRKWALEKWKELVTVNPY
jgi:hypothetical protein